MRQVAVSRDTKLVVSFGHDSDVVCAVIESGALRYILYILQPFFAAWTGVSSSVMFRIMTRRIQ